MSTPVEALRARLVALLDHDAPAPTPPQQRSLLKLCGQIAKKVEEEDRPSWTAWIKELDGYPMLESDQRMVLAARGLRLCQMVAGRQLDYVFQPVSDSPLHQSTESLKGIGPKMASALAARGICSVEDLLWLVPRRYDDVRDVLELEEVLRNPPLGDRVVLRGDIDSVRFVRRGPRGWIDLRLKCPAGPLVVRWFNARPGMCNRYEEGGQAVFAAQLSEHAGNLQMVNPDVLALTSSDGVETILVDGVVPRYGAVPGVPATTIRKACCAASEVAAALVVDAVPPSTCEELGMVSLQDALHNLHNPPDSLSEAQVQALNAGDSEWHRRLAFEELFTLALIVAKRRNRSRADRAKAYPYTELSQRLTHILPFSMTGAQERVITEIAGDLVQPAPMNRLLQGDVGSGKTAVAFAAALHVVAGGGQVAFMAPTTILAEQHHRSLQPWCQKVDIRIALLTAATPKAIRSSTLSLLAAGEIDMLLGTHALLGDAVAFRELGLVLIDEQHRFGVAQRAQLRAKGNTHAPHLLVMTATPIPRTLALTAYGDLDVSILDEMPPGRTPPRTQLLLGAKGRKAAYRALALRIAKGQQAYVVCPMVEAPDDGEPSRYANATDVATELRAALPEHNISLVHGRMSMEERNAAMSDFRHGVSAVLVATTVIEVGVDVPAAIVILIEDADHFGLAQLHQLRGRVGRGGGSSECVLLSSGRASEEGRARLDILVATTDGFVIAEEDLRMRGPGELLGAQQAGLPRLRYGDLQTHADLLAIAKNCADRLVQSDPSFAKAEHQHLPTILDQKHREAFSEP